MKHRFRVKVRNPPLLRIFWKTNWGVSSLNGGTPVRNSNRHTPSAHQSTMQSVCVWGGEKEEMNGATAAYRRLPLWSLLVGTDCAAVAEAETTWDQQAWSDSV